MPTLVFSIYRSGFRFFGMGDAGAQAVVLTAIIFLMTLIYFRLQTRWGDQARAGDWLAFLALTIGAMAMIGPFIWMLSTSLKPVAKQFDMALIPQSPTLENYPRLIAIMPFHLLIWNSFKIAAISVLGQVVTCLMAAFIFAVVRFPGRNFLFVTLLLTLMVPGQITAIPQFIIFKWLGLYGTQAPLYAPAFLGGAFGTFLMRQYFQTIPIELAEAARIDGASLSRIFCTIYLPLAKPASQPSRSLPSCFRGTICSRR